MIKITALALVLFGMVTPLKEDYSLPHKGEWLFVRDSGCGFSSGMFNGPTCLEILDRSDSGALSFKNPKRIGTYYVVRVVEVYKVTSNTTYEFEKKP